MTSAEIFQRVEELMLSAQRASDLRFHRLEFLATAQRPGVIAAASPADRRLSVMRTLAVPTLLQRVVAAVREPVILLKGPEVATRYPAPTLRPFKDLDVLVERPDAAHRALLAAGFEPIPELGVCRHHLQALHCKELPLTVEVHRHPNWPDSLPVPETAALRARARPSRLGIDGVVALDPAAHALVLTAHSWTGYPLARLGHLLDIALIAREAPRETIRTLAAEWGCERMWQTTLAVIDAIFAGAPKPLCLCAWGRHLAAVREPTVVESHAERLLSAWSGLPRRHACRSAVRGLHLTVSRHASEPWSAKRMRARLALGNAFVRRSDHENVLDLAGQPAHAPPTARPT